MLGLMSMMALTTMGISVFQRQKLQKSDIVKLVGVPSNFLPFHMRCTENSILWRDDDLKWKETPFVTLIGLLGKTNEKKEYARDDSGILDFVLRKVSENKTLSFSNQQNSLILWVEPDGIDTSIVFKHLISVLEIPLRIGLLPILKGEEIYNDELETQQY